MGAPRRTGHTLAEVLVVLGLAGILGTAGLSALEFRGASLLLVQREFPGVLEHAFELSRHLGQDLEVALGQIQGSDARVLPFPLPSGVRWGLPPGVPHPLGMAPTKVASIQGAAHVSITVTPRRTCTAGAWFLHNRQGDVLCLRLSGLGQLTVLRWHPRTGAWSRVNP